MNKLSSTGLLVAGMVVVFSGTALAVNKVCPESGNCAGTQQADGLTGTNSVNNIFSYGGNDIVYALGADDVVNGGDGNDFLRGDNGADTLRGQNGLDSLIGNDGEDILVGDPESANAGRTDNVAGGTGDDREYGGPGDDILGNVVFNGKTINDLGNDRLFGGTGDDRFYTFDRERDVIDCGPGEDTVYKDTVDVANESCENVWNKEDRSAAAVRNFEVAGKAASVPGAAEATR